MNSKKGDILDININIEKNVSRIKVCNFDLLRTLKSGQTFRYFLDDIEYENVSLEGAVVMDRNVASLMCQIGDELMIFDSDDDIIKGWIRYFNLEVDYSKIQKMIVDKLPMMNDIISLSSGVRIIHQDLWESIITFITSASNNMQRIKSLVNKLAERYGEKINIINGKEYFSLPSPEKIASLSLSDIRKLGFGFRDKYILDVSKKVSSGEIDLLNIEKLESALAKKALLNIYGIGNKVADCIMLISLNRFDSFPVDVWIERFMKEKVNLEKNMSRKLIEIKGVEMFGDIAGYAQQYMFYYCVEIWKKEDNNKSQN